MEEKADLYLWENLLNGDNNALSDIYKRYVDDLYSYGLKISGNESLVKDCIQEVFIRLMANRKNLVAGSNIHVYLFKSLRSRLLDEMRSGNRRSEILNTKTRFEEEENSPSVEAVTIQNEEQSHIKKKLQTALEGLTEKQREIIFLKFTEGLNYDEISTILGIDKASARTLLYRTLKLIKANIKMKGLILFLFMRYFKK
ncbi:RNA polymerase sigma-70 factor, ECF subfamily [Draconibacterium orientale]|uniref:RNA polymerase ECF-type sigma factor n=1 Tax=Draconibacterium orientale TaxID=1168034 RepID=X5E1Z1_9BACT|nr:RNA polymerase sigma factor [Draconibacterium orientale]AHW60611.1 RNA polymerase ECF-type sigma factor [Draconibacterium orientale]SET05189.1 RNA polymerase sigma-70 factor, ECF subfamily [Draconibacterium orientale]